MTVNSDRTKDKSKPLKKINVQIVPSDESSNSSSNVVKFVHETSDGTTVNVETVRMLGEPTSISSGDECLHDIVQQSSKYISDKDFSGKLVTSENRIK